MVEAGSSGDDIYDDFGDDGDGAPPCLLYDFSVILLGIISEARYI